MGEPASTQSWWLFSTGKTRAMRLPMATASKGQTIA